MHMSEDAGELIDPRDAPGSPGPEHIREWIYADVPDDATDQEQVEAANAAIQAARAAKQSPQ